MTNEPDQQLQKGSRETCPHYYALSTYAMIKLAKIISEAIDPKSFSYVSKSQQTEGYELLLLLAVEERQQQFLPHHDRQNSDEKFMDHCFSYYFGSLIIGL